MLNKINHLDGLGLGYSFYDFLMGKKKSVKMKLDIYLAGEISWSGWMRLAIFEHDATNGR